MSNVSRRDVLAGLAATAAMGSMARVAAQSSHEQRGIVDVHAHFTPPQYIRDLAQTKLLQPPSLRWSIAQHLEEMEQAGIARSILSITTPGISFGDAAQARRMARYSNEYAAELVAAHPKQLGMFTALPLSDVEGSLRELEYGLDKLKSCGVGLFTSYTGKWLGDAAFAPVFEELNRRKAIVYVHPTSATCCTRTLPYIPDALIEYGTDTTRAITNIIYGGAARRYPNVRLIFSHAGGTMPYLIERFDSADQTVAAARQGAPEGYRAAAGKFFYDIAQAANPATLGALRQVIPPSHIVFGTDYPFRTMQEHVTRLEAAKVFSKPQLHGIYRDNALKLLPELLTE